MNNKTTDTALATAIAALTPILDAINEVTGDAYASIWIDVCRGTGGEVTSTCKLYAADTGWHEGETVAATLEKMRAKIKPAMLEKAAALEKQAAELRVKAAAVAA